LAKRFQLAGEPDADAHESCRLVVRSLARGLNLSLSIVMTWQTHLNSGTNLTVTASIADSLGAVSAYSVRCLNVTAPSLAVLTAMTQQLVSLLSNAASINNTLYYEALLNAAGTPHTSCNVRIPVHRE
jgi:hypothetical protein